MTCGRGVDQGDVGAPHDEGLGHLEADVAAADDDDLLAPALLGVGQQRRGVVEGLHAEHAARRRCRGGRGGSGGRRCR